jgi:tetratricopeptide (TPR) repeat protein
MTMRADRNPSAEPTHSAADTLRRAVALHRQGDLAAAEALYGEVLAATPEHPQTLHLFGVLRFQQGRAAEALALIAAALAAKPDAPAMLSNYGLVLDALGRFAEALASYDQALAGAPDDREILANRAATLVRLGRFADALAAYDRLLAGGPDVEALANRSAALLGLKRAEEALESANRALARDPSHPGALNNRGSALHRLGRAAEALATFDDLLRAAPDHVEGLSNRAHVLCTLDRPREALEGCDRALALAPNNVGAHVNRGNALLQLDRADEALACYDRALELRPGQADVIGNRGTALAALGRHDDALATFACARALDPHDPEIRWNQALVQLRGGDFAAGWESFEARWEKADFADGRRRIERPRWRGDEPLAGKTILLHAEQGLGDTIQFVRYVPPVAARGARVVLEVQPALKQLVASLPGVTQLIGRGEPLPDTDLHCPLLSLPRAFATGLDSIPADVPYLRADETRVARWRARLAGLNAPRVGLVWAGNPAHKNDRNRSLALHRLAGLLAVPDAQFVSLQKNVDGADAARLRETRNVLDLGGELVDFADTAAVISLLDLVVTVDTAIAHLAGTLGKPVWILLPFVADWRWLIGREDSPWYPTARLLRQPAIGDWASVLARTCEELRRFLSQSRRRAGPHG